MKVLKEKMNLYEYRDFEWSQPLYAVVKDTGEFAGIPCLSEDEARKLAANHEGSHIYRMRDLGEC